LKLAGTQVETSLDELLMKSSDLFKKTIKLVLIKPRPLDRDEPLPLVELSDLLLKLFELVRPTTNLVEYRRHCLQLLGWILPLDRKLLERPDQSPELCQPFSACSFLL
jgi:hypothetical protein